MFRKLLPVFAVALVLAACDNAPTENASVLDPTLEAVLEASGVGASAANFLQRAPAGLQLTAEQRDAINRINTEFMRANKADLDVLTAITREAITAGRNGATPEAIRAILEPSRPTRERLAPAFAALARSLNAVLTDAQRAWLADNARRLGPQLPPLGPRRP